MKRFSEFSDVHEVTFSGIGEFEKRMKKYLDRVINDIKPSDTPDRVKKKFMSLAQDARTEWTDISRDDPGSKR